MNVTVETVILNQLIINLVSLDSESEELGFHVAAVLFKKHDDEHRQEVEPKHNNLDSDPDDCVTHLV